MTILKKILKFLDQNAEMVLMYVATVGLVASVTLQIISRTIMMPFSWTEEVARYAFVWITFLGIGYGVRTETHTRIELFDSFMSTRVKLFTKVLTSLVGLFVWGTILYISKDFIAFTAANRAPALNVTILVRNLSVIVGSTITLIRLVQRLILDIMKLADNFRGKGEKAA